MSERIKTPNQLKDIGLITGELGDRIPDSRARVIAKTAFFNTLGRGIASSRAQKVERMRHDAIVEDFDRRDRFIEEYHRKLVDGLASGLHENWRRTRLQEDGSYEPRVKSTKDEAWIAAHGTDEVDIANTRFEDLPTDWQAENAAAAQVVVEVLGKNGDGLKREGSWQVDLEDEATRTAVGDIVHTAWLERNDWAKGGELDVPFADLPAEEQAKDIEQIEMGMRILPTVESPKL